MNVHFPGSVCRMKIPVPAQALPLLPLRPISSNSRRRTPQRKRTVKPAWARPPNICPPVLRGECSDAGWSRRAAPVMSHKISWQRGKFDVTVAGVGLWWSLQSSFVSGYRHSSLWTYSNAFYWLRSDFAEFRRNWLTSPWTLHQTAGESFVTPGSLTCFSCFIFSNKDFMICHKLVFHCTEFFSHVHVDVCVREWNKNKTCLWANKWLMSTS